jgi:hypothetical protein
MRTTTLPSRMRGISFVGWMLIGAVVIVFATAGVRIVPAFLEFNTISGAINSVLQDPKIGFKTDTEILSDLGKRFSINNVEAISVEDIIVTREGPRVTLSVDYEVRGNLYGNIDLLMTFKEDFVKELRQ